MTRITLTSSGEQWTGFQSLSITQSMDQAAHTLSLTTTDRYNEGIARWNVSGGSEIQVHIDDELVFDGYVTKYKPSISAESHSVSIEAASKAIDLVECSHLGPYFWKNTSAESIIADLVAPFGLEYRIEGAMKAIPATGFRMAVTDSPFSVIVKLAEKNGLTAYTDSKNVLVLSKTPATALSSSIVTGDYTQIDTDHDLAQSFSEVVVKAQQNTDSKDFASKQRIEKRFANPAQTRHRPLVIVSNGDEAEQADLGEYAKRRFAGNVLGAAATVKRLLNKNDEVWAINQLVFVDVPVADVRQKLLITNVTFSVDESSGFQVQLGMRLPESYSALPVYRPDVRRSTGAFSSLLDGIRTVGRA